MKLVFCVLLLGLTSIHCYAFEGYAASKDGNVRVSYRVDGGYRVFVRIDTNTKKSAYQNSEKSDVNSIEVVFVDVNKDGYLDVMIQHADETGYVPAMLINHGNQFFTNALLEVEKQFKAAFYVNTEVDLIEEGRQPSGVSYQVKDMNGDGIPELVFYNSFINGKGYRYVAFQFDKKKLNYHLYEKGRMFLEQ